MHSVYLNNIHNVYHPSDNHRFNSKRIDHNNPEFLAYYDDIINDRYVSVRNFLDRYYKSYELIEGETKSKISKIEYYPIEYYIEFGLQILPAKEKNIRGIAGLTKEHLMVEPNESLAEYILAYDLAEICKLAERKYLISIGEDPDKRINIEESKLFKAIYKRYSKQYKVEREAKEPWLVYKSYQRFDIYIRELGIAIEYHGQQHYEETPYFHRTPGAFQEQLKKDQNKRDLCEANGVLLIEVREGYELKDLLKKIDKIIEENESR